MRLRFLLLITLLTGVSSSGFAKLSAGMSTEEVQAARGHPESKMELGPNLIYIYADGTRLEFSNDKLYKEDGIALLNENSNAFAATPTPQPKENTTFTASPLGTEIDIEAVESRTITATTTNKEDKPFETLSHYNEGIEVYESGFFDDYEESPSKHTPYLGISFVIELIVTFTVLAIAFRVSGFPLVIHQIAILSVAKAIFSLLFYIFMGADLLNPFRGLASFFILVVLIRQLTDVRKWQTAIKIAVIARVVSIAVLWLATMGDRLTT